MGEIRGPYVVGSFAGGFAIGSRTPLRIRVASVLAGMSKRHSWPQCRQCMPTVVPPSVPVNAIFGIAETALHFGQAIGKRTESFGSKVLN